jgi:hypothetical protein
MLPDDAEAYFRRGNAFAELVTMSTQRRTLNRHSFSIQALTAPATIFNDSTSTFKTGVPDRINWTAHSPPGPQP